MKLTIHTFAEVKEQFTQNFEFDVEGVRSVKDLKDELIRRKPETASLLNRCRFAVDETFVNDATLLNEHTTVYIVPPSSGG